MNNNIDEDHAAKIAKWVNEYVVKNRLLPPGQDLKIVVTVKNPVAELKFNIAPANADIYDADAITSFHDWAWAEDNKVSIWLITLIKNHLPIWLDTTSPTIGDVIFYGSGDPRGFEKFRWCGPKTIRTINAWLSSLGLKLGMKKED